MAKLLPPDVFLRAYGNDKCRRDVASMLENSGYTVAIFPSGKKQLRRGDEVISEFNICWKPATAAAKYIQY